MGGPDFSDHRFFPPEVMNERDGFPLKHRSISGVQSTKRTRKKKIPNRGVPDSMIEITFIGRGGQGAVIASQILAKVYFLMGLYPQCYSLFGGERRGAPVASFLRVYRTRYPPEM